MTALTPTLSTRVRRMFVDDEQDIHHHHVLELEYVHLHGGLPPDYPASDEDDGRRLQAIHQAIHTSGHTALCLSGGGIRSASFASGVLQGLAARGLLGAVDFLSTVSGGGYTGGWLSAWLYHASQEGKEPDAVFRELAGQTSTAIHPEAEPLRRIREYSSYLDPKVGLFSVDVWTLVSTVARNLLLNWLVLIPLLAAALLVPRVYYSIVGLGSQYWLDPEDLNWWSWWLLGVAFGLEIVALGYIVVDLPSGGNRHQSQRTFLMLCFGPLFVATAALTLYWAWSRELDPILFRARTLMLIGAAVHTATWVVAGLAGTRKWRPRTWAAAAVSGAAGGLGLWWFATHAFANPLARAELFASVGVPLILVIFGLAGTLFIGLASSDTSDEDREWWSRFGGWLLIATSGWLLASLVVFVGPRVVHWAIGHIAALLQVSPNKSKGLAGLLTAIAGGVAARSGREAPNQKMMSAQRLAFMLAAPTFVVLLLVGLATLNVALVTRIDALGLLTEYIHPEGAGLPEIAAVWLLLVIGGLAMGLVVAVNKFSLHGMYRNRLIRAFLGASRPKTARHPNLFTGFDPEDNIAMWKLARTRRPLHVVNMALNLVADSRLAWQERKAESFTVSPLCAGTYGLGYRPAARYGNADGMTLGTAITISGAAASPNMGYNSSPAMTFLLTLFNARLGAWLGNPGPAGGLTWTRSDPLLGAGPLLREMFGRTTDANPYVYLSDGGHFENLALYEMVSRRCRHIVVCDAGCDPTYTFEDLGNAIRKIRIDLGIPIVFRSPLKIDETHAGAGNAHGAIGEIQYSAVDGPGTDGVLIYLKATLSGNEPVDVKNYAAAHPGFPHEPTTDQWFGESQFESYRALGRHTVDEVAGQYDGGSGMAGLAAAFKEPGA